MLILASILLLSGSNHTDGPFSSTPPALFSPSYPRDADPTPPCPRQRIQIICTCVATILAASWVSVHPNIPNPKESKIMKALRRIELMIWAIITPELIIYWAMRQWHGARSMEREFAEYQGGEGFRNYTELERLARKVMHSLKRLGYRLRHLRKSKDKELTSLARKTPNLREKAKWTRTHGFFLQMGGFLLREEGQKDRVLGWSTPMKYYKQGRLDLSGVAEDRINDHSKADGFAKGLALLQMLWFITQCIARFSDSDLILTEIELATAALALLSLVMYFLWWNKPLNAGVPIIITLLPLEKKKTRKDIVNSRPESLTNSNPGYPPKHYSQPATGFVATNDGAFLQTLSTHLPSPQSARPQIHRAYEDMISDGIGTSSCSSLPSNSSPPPACKHPNRPDLHDQMVSPRSVQLANRCHSSDVISSGAPSWYRFTQIVTGGPPDMRILRGDSVPIFEALDDSAVTSVPIFYSVPADSDAAYLKIALTSFSAAAALFGCIHCIGWSSRIVFTSHVASLAWRIASVVITASPVVWCLGIAFAYVRGVEVYRPALEEILYCLGLSGYYVTAVTILMYIAARLVLLVLALAELRDVPPGALASIQWVDVLPFIH
ncbi:hypothetical protein D9613_008673 [Agrocybe pediades]|uniref:Uncharacterized protein n=1 Tax=Agrocybe pediades TaxID=84607 RepID=A0A8H4QU31_9AGAR|nr:hypothetical protein D9613_008673 [Agrocybe pediades]